MVADVSNSPSFDDAAVLKFFQTSTRNLLAAEAAAGAGHHVALSVVGSERLPGSGYLRAKLLVRNTLRERHDPREVITDPHAPYYGANCTNTPSSPPPAPASPRSALTTG